MSNASITQSCRILISGLTHKLFTTLTVKRSFTVMNTGEVVFTIVNMSINNVPCENRGFRILNCHPFRLKPNETHILDIALVFFLFFS